MNSGAVFSQAPTPPDGQTDAPDTPPCRAELRDQRRDFNVVFIHSRLDDYRLPPAPFRVYAHLARRAGNGEAFPAVKSIAAVCLLHPKTVRTSLRLLVEHNLVRRGDRPGRTAIYTLTAADEWRPPNHITDNPCQMDTPVSDGKATPPKRIQAHPSQTEPAEGYPSEGDPQKVSTQAPRALASGLPSSEDEAIEQAVLVGIPPDFARTEFCRLDATGWLNGAGIPVRKWVAHLRKRWADDQSQRAERQTRAATRPGRAGQFVPPRKFTASDYQKTGGL